MIKNSGSELSILEGILTSNPRSNSIYRGKREIGGVYLPYELERTVHHNFVRDGR